MKKLLYIFYFLSFLLSTSACSKTEYNLFSSIYGTISDAETGEPISAAIVSLSPGGKTSMSRDDGTYEFTDLDIMQYTVMVQKEGYQTNRKQATAITGEKVRVDIVMHSSK